MASEQKTNANEAIAQAVAEATRTAIEAMAWLEQKEHKMWDPD